MEAEEQEVFNRRGVSKYTSRALLSEVSKGMRLPPDECGSRLPRQTKKQTEQARLLTGGSL